MLSREKYEEVVRLLSEGGLSQRKIARRTGVSRAAVADIFNGRPRNPPAESDPLRGEEHPYRHGPVGRCPTCGSRVYLPCVLCRTRDFEAGRRDDRRQRAGRDAKPAHGAASASSSSLSRGR